MEKTKNNNPGSTLFILWTILAAGLFVRIWGLWSYQYNPDEMEFLIMAKGPTLAEVWRRSLAEMHPPLAHFIRHELLMLTSDVFIQRLFSIAAGMAAVLAMYRLGVRLGGPLMGCYCAVCMALMPVAVSTSMTIRNYAFFMGFLSWALFFFVRYQQNRKRQELFAFNLLLWLACATHFSGFLVAAICGTSEACRLLISRQFKMLFVFCLSYIPLCFLAIFLYCNFFIPGKALPMWNHMDAVTYRADPANYNFLTGVLSYLIPFLNLLKHKQMGGPGIISTLAVLAGVVLLVLHIIGLYRMCKVAPAAGCLVVTAWLIAIAMTYIQLYPFAGTRHSYYFLPFFILPFWYIFEPFAYQAFRYRYMVVLCVVMLAIGLKASHCYEWYGEEIGLKNKDYIAGQEYLDSHLSSGDAIVTGRVAAYFYLLYAKDGGQTAYDSYADFPYKNQTLLWAPFDPPWRPHSGWQPFRDDLKTRLNQRAGTGGNVWFFMVGAKNIELWDLLYCRDIQSDIRNFFSRDNVLIFSVSANKLTDFLKNTSAWEHCYADYKPLIAAELFPAILLPQPYSP